MQDPKRQYELADAKLEVRADGTARISAATIVVLPARGVGKLDAIKRRANQVFARFLRRP